MKFSFGQFSRALTIEQSVTLATTLRTEGNNNYKVHPSLCLEARFTRTL